ncbi:MAG: DUF4118 domain-containing protein [Eubacteriales bacterium]|nr:DUF4118 domain-containing protein [Eubacteriales bacterium]
MQNKRLDFLRDPALTAVFLTASTLLGMLLRLWGLQKTNIVVVYIFSVLLVSRSTRGYGYGIAASVLSILLFNWFFTEPYYTLKVYDPTYIVTFAIMMFTSIVTGTLTSKVKQAAADAKQREAESNALYQMTNHLTDAEDTEEIAKIAVTTVSNVLLCNAACICFDENGMPEKTFIQRRPDGSLIRRELSGAEELRQRMEQLHGPADITEREALYPIYGKTQLLAVLCVPKEIGAGMSGSQTRMLHSVIESSALALERLRSLQEQARTREEATQERYRGNLLRAISHDIRTPLSGIMGTSEMIMDTTQPDDPRYELAKDIYRDADWLHGLVENILSLTKLQSGKMTLDKQPEALEEVIGAALTAMEKRLPGRVIDVEMPEEVLMIPMDAKLVSQVLINLLDNAAKHTPTDAEISISVAAEDENVRVTVADRGSGIAESDLPRVFQMFYTARSKSPDAKRGVGLGLAICRSVAQAHGGSICAENRPGGGAAFTLTLPLGDERI